MPTKAKKPCNATGCRELVEGGTKYCEKHNVYKNEVIYKTPEYKKLYSTVAWKKIRHWVLSKEPFCVNCLKAQMVKKAEVVDHIIDHKGDRTLFYSVDNLQSLCKSCHDKKTRRDNG